MSTDAGPHPAGELSLHLHSLADLYAAYMPFFRRGGLFVPTARRYAMGCKLRLRVSLPKAAEPLHMSGEVAWMTPVGAQGNRTAGVGVHFEDSVEAARIRGSIESLLEGLLGGERATQTM